MVRSIKDWITRPQTEEQNDATCLEDFFNEDDSSTFFKLGYHANHAYLREKFDYPDAQNRKARSQTVLIRWLIEKLKPLPIQEDKSSTRQSIYNEIDQQLRRWTRFRNENERHQFWLEFAERRAFYVLMEKQRIRNIEDLQRYFRKELQQALHSSPVQIVKFGVEHFSNLAEHFQSTFLNPEEQPLEERKD